MPLEDSTSRTKSQLPDTLFGLKPIDLKAFYLILGIKLIGFFFSYYGVDQLLFLDDRRKASNLN